MLTALLPPKVDTCESSLPDAIAETLLFHVDITAEPGASFRVCCSDEVTFDTVVDVDDCCLVALLMPGTTPIDVKEVITP